MRIEANLAGLCIEQDHRWSSWSLWTAHTPRVASQVMAGPQPCMETFKAVRTRLCRRCGCVEQEDKSGNREIVRDPHGIEEYRNRG